MDSDGEGGRCTLHTVSWEQRRISRLLPAAGARPEEGMPPTHHMHKEEEPPPPPDGLHNEQGTQNTQNTQHARTMQDPYNAL